MTLECCCRIAVLIVLSAGFVAGALASDDESEPLYVIHNGQRIPTVIIPPKPGSLQPARPALVRVVQGIPAAVPNAQDADAPDQPRWPDDATDDPESPYLGRRYHDVGHYAGYPVSIPRRPRPDWGYAPYVPYAPPRYYGDVLKETYRAQRWIRDRERGRVSNVRDMKRRKARVLAGHEKALRRGLEELRAGHYAQAVIALTMAAELNHADPACRIHLAQARLAQRHYGEAAKVLRRALQLQPMLVYVSLNLRSYYPDPGDFDTHVDELASWVRKHRGDGSACFLLGYLEFQRENYNEAYAAFRVAARAMPRDSLTRSYLKITKPPSE